MDNKQSFCDKCDKLLYDKKKGINLPRHDLSLVLGYSACGTWGYRKDAYSRKSKAGYCTECFNEIWVATRPLAEKLGYKEMPICILQESGKYYNKIKKLFGRVRTYGKESIFNYLGDR